MNLDILYEDKNFLAVNKPAGLLVHGHQNTDEETVVTWITKHRPEIKNVGDDPQDRPGIVHRLDKATSGVLLIAKTQEYFLYLKSLFQQHEIKKTYCAFTWGSFKAKEGVVDKPIGIVSGSIRRSIRSSKMMKPAVTEYRVKKEYAAPDNKIISFVHVFPKTGRTHQIRVHLASIGHPIVGDALYGPRKRAPKSKNNKHEQVSAFEPSRLMLHALSVEFAVTPGHRVRIEAPPPPEFKLSF